ncbi:MAG: DUF2155 domain-containing protein [Hyphomicrobiales bacterium]|nr:DUF2155 domain-containing protein [Hyphomicrobiales bacterium]
MTPRKITAALGFGMSLVALPAQADKIANPSATFEGLDKITGRIISFDVAVGETVQFGSLQLTARVCYSRPPTEAANSTAFIEVNEVTFSNEYRRIFTGWVFGSSPGLHAIEHPIYDIWLTDCKGGKDVIVEAKEEEETVEPELKGSLNKPAPPKEKSIIAPSVATNGRIAPPPELGVPVQAPVARPTRSFFSIFGGGGGAPGAPLPIQPRQNDSGR